MWPKKKGHSCVTTVYPDDVSNHGDGTKFDSMTVNIDIDENLVVKFTTTLLFPSIMES